MTALYLRNQMIDAQKACCSAVTTRLRVVELHFFIVVKRAHLHRACGETLEKLRSDHVMCTRIFGCTCVERSMCTSEICIRPRDVLPYGFDRRCWHKSNRVVGQRTNGDLCGRRMRTHRSCVELFRFASPHRRCTADSITLSKRDAVESTARGRPCHVRWGGLERNAVELQGTLREILPDLTTPSCKRKCICPLDSVSTVNWKVEATLGFPIQRTVTVSPHGSC